VSYIGLSARVYDSLAPSGQFHIVLHQKNMPIDLSLAWEEFKERFNVYEVVLLP
jgi:hypothetical protein